MPERVQLDFTSLVGLWAGLTWCRVSSAPKSQKTRAVLGDIAQEQLAQEMEMCVIKLLSCIAYASDSVPNSHLSHRSASWHQCLSSRLGNANKLIDGLGGEKDRWSQTVSRLEVDGNNKAPFYYVLLLYIYIIYIHIHNYIMHIITNSILHFTYIYYYTEYMCYTRILPSTLESDGPQNSPSLARSVASPKSMNFCPVTPWWPLEWWAMLAPSLASTAKVLRSFGCRRRTTRASHTSRVPLWWVCLDNRLGTEPLG
jgi:hypothetical protein